MSLKENLMNAGAAILPAEPAGPNPQLVALAEQILADVKAGVITSLAAITVSAGGRVQWPGFGSQAPEMYLGANLFARQIEAMVTGQGKSRILRAG